MNDIAWLTERPIAHRGYHDLNRERWENTLAAFEAAAEKGYAIECDVRLSADGVPVVFHDAMLKRLTGQPGRLQDLAAEAIAGLKVGGTSETVPTLDAALSLVGGRVPLIIELKGAQGADEGLVGAVASRLADYAGKAAIMSFDHWLIRRFAHEAPGVPAGLTAYGREDSHMEAHFSMLAHPLSFVSYGVADLPNRFVFFLREHMKMPVITWTVTDEAAVNATFEHADQMTFEGFDPDSGEPF